MRAYALTLAAFSLLLSASHYLTTPAQPPAAQAYDLLLAGGPEAAQAVTELRALVRKNPANPYVWATLAEALAQTGDPTTAHQAMLQAVALGPSIPRIRLRAANLFAELDNRPAAAQNLAIVLGNTAEYNETVFEAFRRFGLTPTEILIALQDNPRAARAWFWHVRWHGAPQDLRLTWDWLLTRGYIDPAMAASYLEFSAPPLPSRTVRPSTPGL